MEQTQLEKQVLSKLAVEESWVHEQLNRDNVGIKDIFLATINEQQTLSITTYDDMKERSLPPIYH